MNWNTRTDTVSILDLRNGAQFRCIDNHLWKRDHLDRSGHAVWATRLDTGKLDVFSACAMVLPLTK